jgi:hypothetical protein
MAIHHVVWIKFKKGAAKEKIDQFITELNRLPDFNREVFNWISGFTPEPRFHNGDFDYGLACDLPDWAGMDRYMYHEGHVRMGPFVGDVIDQAISFDFATDFVQPKSYQSPPPSDERRENPPAGKGYLPRLMGRRIDEARRMVEAAGLKVGKIEEQPNIFWAEGRVTEQKPAPGILDRGASVDLVISNKSRVGPKFS